MRVNRFMFFIRPILSLEEHLGVTNSPHSPLSASYITLPAYDKSLPPRLNYLHNQIVPYCLCISDRLVVHSSIPASAELRAHCMSHRRTRLDLETLQQTDDSVYLVLLNVLFLLSYKHASAAATN